MHKKAASAQKSVMAVGGHVRSEAPCGNEIQFIALYP